MRTRLRRLLGLAFVLTAAVSAIGLLAGCGAASYTAVFMADGETVVTVDCTDGVPVDTVPVPQKPGYTGAWSAAEWDGDRLVVTAVYTPNAYYVTFRAHNDMLVDVVAYTAGDAAVEEPEVPYRYGYEGSWEPYSLADGGNLTVRAVYAPIEYTVTYIAEGQTIAVVTGTYETPPEAPAVPEKPGYTGRWEMSATDGYDMTMTAVYMPIQYQVTLQGGGANGRLSGGGRHGYGESVTLTAVPYGGYAFAGWYDGETPVSAEVSFTFTMPARDVTYAARFAVRADMAPFTFTSDARSCTVTGVTDPAVTALTVPDCVTDIAFGALGPCTALTSLTVPTEPFGSDYEGCSLGYWFGADYYEYNAAYVPATLTEVTVTGGTLLAYHAFYNCPSLERVILPDTLTSISGYAFYGCENLAEITIPSGVTSIGRDAFYGCKSLTEITIPAGVTEIAHGTYGTFGYCTALTRITLPSGLTRIGTSAFSGCASLTEITIPAGVTEIGAYAFSVCASLTEIALPSGVTSIGESAFSSCKSLTEITIPPGVRVLEGRMFSNCTALRRIDLPSGLYSIGREAFYNCTSLTEIEIPAGVTEIADGGSAGTFENCTALITITLPAGLTSIGNRAFYGCASLTEITIPSGVTEIGYSAFYGCASLTEIALPSGVIEIGDVAFSGCTSLTEITLPSGVTNIGQQTFRECTSLTEITIPSGLTSIGNDAFYGCNSLTAVWYGGDEAAWEAVSVGTSNGSLTGKVYFYSPAPPEGEGKYWHYADDGVTPVAW